MGGGRARRRPRAGQPRPARLRLRARRRLRGRRLGLRRGADARRRLGVDLVRVRRLPGLRGLPLPRVLRGLLRRRLQGPARRRLGDAPQRHPAELPQLGPPRAPADLLRLPLRKGRDERDRHARPGHDRRPPAPRRPARGHGRRRPRGALLPVQGAPPKYFYDERGSELFEQITELPEYYPTRAERAILDAARGRDRRGGRRRRHPDRARLGLGGEDALPARRDARAPAALETYVPVDISEEITRRTADELVAEYEGLRVHGVVCDYETHLERIPARGGRRDRLPRRHDRQLPARAAALLPRPDRDAARTRATASCSAPTWSRTGAASRPPTTTRPASPRSSTRTC